MDIFNIFAGLASIFGVIFAFLASRSSKSASETAASIKSDFINKNESIQEYNRLKSFQSTVSHLSKQLSDEIFSPTNKSLIGYSPNNLSLPIEEFRDDLELNYESLDSYNYTAKKMTLKAIEENILFSPNPEELKKQAKNLASELRTLKRLISKKLLVLEGKALLL
jgi:hypothetical protein